MSCIARLEIRGGSALASISITHSRDTPHLVRNQLFFGILNTLRSISNSRSPLRSILNAILIVKNPYSKEKRKNKEQDTREKLLSSGTGFFFSISKRENINKEAKNRKVVSKKG